MDRLKSGWINPIMNLSKVDWVNLVAAIAVCQLAGVIGSIFTIPNIPTWYAGLMKPSFAPPGSLIGIVWLILYALMGIALYLVWKKGMKKQNVKESIAAFGTQLILNTAWSFLFFGMRSPLYGLICIIAMWIAIVYTMLKFWKVSKNAFYLMVPYLAWVTFAGALNFLIWRMN